MFVISRNTAFTYRHKSVDTKQIGRELGVRYVLEGSVRRSGNQVRLNVQLIDAEADVNVWAKRFARQLSDLFELQDEITTAIAGAIEPELLKIWTQLRREPAGAELIVSVQQDRHYEHRATISPSRQGVSASPSLGVSALGFSPD